MRYKKVPYFETRRCQNCIHFYQHYVKLKDKENDFIPCYCGHCRYPRIKNVKPDMICEFFTEKTEPTS